MEQSWDRRHPFAQLDRDAIQQRVRAAFPSARVLAAEPLHGGLRNSNYRVEISDPPTRLVLRLYTADPAACRREATLAARLGGLVPVPALFHAAPDADPPFAITAWIDGSRVDDLLATASPPEIARISCAAGATLAAIHRVRFPAPGFLGPSLGIAQPLPMGGADWARYVGRFLGRPEVAGRLGDELTGRLRRLVATQAWRLDPLRDASALVHADYKPWNLLARPAADNGPAPRSHDGGWVVAGVLDWEFAFAGAPLFDLAIFLRQEASFPPEYREGFVAGYRTAGGTLPDDWQTLTKLLDLLNLCSMLEGPGLGDAFVRDAVRLLEGTLAALAGP